jgi:hypothetical protein
VAGGACLGRCIRTQDSSDDTGYCRPGLFQAFFLALFTANTTMPLDTLRSVGAKMFLNKYFEFLGEIEEVSINPDIGMASMLIALKGESARVKLDVSYRLGTDAFVLENFRCEREWIENTLNKFFAGKSFDMGDGLVQTLVKQLL